jgi:hypothetical protein
MFPSCPFAGGGVPVTAGTGSAASQIGYLVIDFPGEFQAPAVLCRAAALLGEKLYIALRRNER